MSRGTLEEAWLAEEILGVLGSGLSVEATLSRIQTLCELAVTPRDVKPLNEKIADLARFNATTPTSAAQVFKEAAAKAAARVLAASDAEPAPEFPNAVVEGEDAGA